MDWVPKTRSLQDGAGRDRVGDLAGATRGAGPGAERAPDAPSPGPTTCRSAQGAERCAEFFTEELWLFPRGKVPALVDLVEVDDVGVRLLDPAARRPPDLAGVRREAERELHRRWGLAVRPRGRPFSLPGGPGRPRPRARHPVDLAVGAGVVPREVVLRLPV